MQIVPTRIPDVKIIKPRVFGDERGFFMETWNAKAFKEAGLDVDFVQDNQSRSIKNTLRGLHYQIQQPQGKLVRVTSGEVFDVAVDMRKSSPTYGEWVGVFLSEHNKEMLWIPEGFAHGFYVVSEQADFQYKCTEIYAPEHERVLAWDDQDVGIEWPVLDGVKPIISSKDALGISFLAADFYS